MFTCRNIKRKPIETNDCVVELMFNRWKNGFCVAETGYIVFIGCFFKLHLLVFKSGFAHSIFILILTCFCLFRDDHVVYFLTWTNHFKLRVWFLQVSNEATYQEVVRATCGKVTGVLCEVAIAVYTFGTCIAFFIVIGDQLDRCEWFFKSKSEEKHSNRRFSGFTCLFIYRKGDIKQCSFQWGGQRASGMTPFSVFSPSACLSCDADTFCLWDADREEIWSVCFLCLFKVN